MSEIENWITTNAGADLAGYSQAYVRQLARGGRIRSRKAGRDWLALREDLLQHRISMDRLGVSKHNPWREDLEHHRR